MSGRREEISPVGLGGEGKERKEKREKKVRERKEDSKASSSYFRHSDGRSSLGRELKSIYVTRATPQEVWTLPTLVISTLRAVWLCFLP